MNFLIVALKILIAVSIINVWLFRNRKESPWRGGKATTLAEEFRSYGFPSWFMFAVGTFKVGLALMLILSIWFPVLNIPAASGIAVLMLGAVSAHFYIKDPTLKSLPAATFLIASLIILAFA